MRLHIDIANVLWGFLTNQSGFYGERFYAKTIGANGYPVFPRYSHFGKPHLGARSEYYPSRQRLKRAHGEHGVGIQVSMPGGREMRNRPNLSENCAMGALLRSVSSQSRGMVPNDRTEFYQTEHATNGSNSRLRMNSRFRGDA